MTRTTTPAAATAGNRFGIAALQLELERGDNIARIAAEVAIVRKVMPWIRMCVVGELAAFGAARDRAAPMPGPVEERLQDIARRNAVWLVPGSVYERDGERLYNTAPVIAPDGTVVARYRKQFPFYPYEEGIACGAQPVVFDVPGAGRFGVSICYDGHFPETTRSLCWLGAEVILHPTMTWTIDREVELAIARASAASNQCYFVDVNVAGELGNGRSIICGPGGEIVHQAGSGREIITFEVDFAHLRTVRERGWQGLCQQLKSLRDSEVVFPAYGAGMVDSEYMNRLGPLRLPQADDADPS